MSESKSPEGHPSFRDLPFRQLIEQDEELAELRRSYAQRPAKERLKAAGWTYDESFATDIFNRALSRVENASPFPSGWQPGIQALAIEPTFAPALLTVGSMECQLGRISEAMELFETLLRLPNDTTDLEEILDKAGACLIEQGNGDEASALYEAACSRFPNSALLLGGLSYSLAKQGRQDQALAIQRRAVALQPENPELLSDLGWALAESRQYDEAEQVLQKAVILAPPDYNRPRYNLEEVRRLKQADRAGGSQPTNAP